MFIWNKKYKWIFSDLGASDKVGINDVGIGVFKKQPYKGLAKEILQNVTDAKYEELTDDIPVKAVFELISVDRDDIPGYERINDVIHKCYEYYPDGDDGKKLKVYRDAADRYLSNPGKVPVLKISDYKTYGLRGVHEEKDTNWTKLVRERGATNKSNDKSGAFGVGKFAPFNFSALRTILYSTLARTPGKPDEIAFQGKTILTTFKEDGKNKQNIGLFANEYSDNYDAVFNVDEIAPIFRRTDYGTDIFVLGYEKEDDWKDQIAMSVVEHFFYSIYKGRLEVDIKENDEVVSINKSNIGAMIDFYQQRYEENGFDDSSQPFTAPRYWRVLNDQRTIKIPPETYKYNGHDMGGYDLYLLTGDDITERRVLEMRQAGMKIREDISFRIQFNFIGIFIATGEGALSTEPEDNISSFLRKCEGQAHDDWSAEEYSKEKSEKEKAKKIIDDIHKLILKEVKKLMPEIDQKPVDAFGLVEYLAVEDDGEENHEEKAYNNFLPLDFELRSIKTGKRRRKADISMKKNGGSKRIPKPDVPKPVEPVPDSNEPKKHRDNHKGTGLDKGVEVFISNVKTPYIAQTDEYRISFVMDEDANDFLVELKISSDDNNLNKAEIVRANINGKQLLVKNGMIAIGSGKKGEKKVLIAKLKESTRKSLEVRAYAKR